MIYVDTAAFLALFAAGDQHHEAAAAAWEELAHQSERCLTSNLVVAELLTLLGRRTSYQFAAERGRDLYGSPRLTILRPAEHEEVAALAVFEKYADQNVSFADCVSFVLMKAHRVKRVFTYDRHFALAGFQTWPAKR